MKYKQITTISIKTILMGSYGPVQNAVVFAKNEPHAMHLHGPRNFFFIIFIRIWSLVQD